MNTSRPLLLIMAHDGATETFHRHLPLWSAHGCDMVILCPMNHPVWVPDNFPHPVICFGERQHHGADANRRFKLAIWLMAQLDYRAFWFFEYDAFCLQKDLPVIFHRSFVERSSAPESILAGNIFHDDRPDRGFVGQTFIHPPLYITKPAAQLLDAQLRRLEDNAEQGMWDRLLGLAAEECQFNSALIPLDFLTKGLGFARNTIEVADIAQAVEAVKHGAIFIHGCKDAAVLGRLKDAHKLSSPRLGEIAL